MPSQLSRPVEIIPEAHPYVRRSDPVVAVRVALSVAAPPPTDTCPGRYHSDSWFPALVHPWLFQS
ncbi:hypothetical protein [Streptacidiphilus sp. MAP12-16]|uniref:hypothetical protein n=1 Tax=Streptacidiphilus sp. MAP12-16 TaxID=3156300 RepID=UPI0035127CC0